MKEIIDVPEIFGSHVFNDRIMRQRLPKNVYKELKETIELGKELNPAIADTVANAMKDWAVEMGATHFTHWFQPMTGVTAEKHDAFINPTSDGKVLLEFSGKELIKGEPDASSFPSGGLRATFEARGYTAWDCTSPAFVKETPGGTIVLCIPTAFCSYTGEALDYKTPLLRSMDAINTQALRVLRCLGNTTSKRVVPSVGPEQEYFLVDRALYKQRKDLIFTGRTLFGAMPPKGQEMDDHYFGSVKERVSSFMNDLNIELWKLGISAKTQHNEVAPAQHELAPVYATINVATDHNQLIMEIMRKVAMRKGLKCLLHEKPFNGVNGSGKHDNWSLVTDDGINLLEPGKTPHENTHFLLFLVAILQAVDDYSDLLRLSASSVGNDLRLGGNEAPPAIISVFLGEQLHDVLNQLEKKGEATSSIKGQAYDAGVSTLPSFRQDATDRNRTSPFAFTGNKFEFRMVGSTQSVAAPNIVLNTIVAESLRKIADELEYVEDKDKDDVIHRIITSLIMSHKRIIFDGDGYSEEWYKEAERRGLKSINSMVDAIPAMTSEDSKALFERHHVFTETELKARADIHYEIYSKAINIEAKTMIEMAKKQIMPAVIEYQAELAKGVNALKAAGISEVSVQMDIMEKIAKELKDMGEALKKLEASSAEAVKVADDAEKAHFFHDRVVPDMEALRAPADRLELLLPRTAWPFPQYAELMFDI